MQGEGTEHDRQPLPEIADLHGELAALVGQIPPGTVTTFGTLGRALGDVGAAKWIAQVVLERLADASAEREHDSLPWHRVVYRDGRVAPWQSARLALHVVRRLVDEGVPMRHEASSAAEDDGEWFVRLDDCRDVTFESTAPLWRLQEHQRDVARRVETSSWLTDPTQLPTHVAGVDIAYPDERTARAVYAVVEVATGKRTFYTIVDSPVRFPYIAGYLAYRELPPLVAVLEAARAANELVELVLVDGNGRLHDRQCGVACHLGVVTGVRTIGVGKTLLCGDVDEAGLVEGEFRDIVCEGATAGYLLRTRPGGKPLYLSPGHRVSLADIPHLLRPLLRGHRLPEPLFWADHLSKHG